MTVSRTSAILGASLTVLAALGTGTVLAAGPPAAATTYATAVIPPAGGSVSDFGITAMFAPGAVTSDRLIVLGNWPNGLDVTPPSGTPVKTFGLQECNVDGGGCTGEFGDYPNSPAGTEKIHSRQLPFTAGHPLPDTAGNTNFGTAAHKLISITTRTGADRVYVYNPNVADTARAYPMLLPSTSTGQSLTFQTFRPIVWTLTAPPA